MHMSRVSLSVGRNIRGFDALSDTYIHTCNVSLTLLQIDYISAKREEAYISILDTRQTWDVIRAALIE
jgi:hypothetical protein